MQHTVSIQQMKEALRAEVGSREPLMITRKDEVSVVVYVRGFADQQTNILLISESPDSISLKILEIRDIRSIQFMDKNGKRTGRSLEAKWFKPVKRYNVNIEGFGFESAGHYFGTRPAFSVL